MGDRLRTASSREGGSPGSAADERSSWMISVRLPVSSTLGLLLMVHLLLAMMSLGGRATGREYCLDEIVEIQCGTGEILIVESAKFGRMQLNRCVKTDYGYIGCSSDVTDILAGKCSGRRHCRIFNIEVLFSGTKPCPQDLKSYLEVTFSCAKVVLPVQTTSCLQGGPLTVQSTKTSSSGLIASITSYEHGVGESGCPWLIDALPGQRINLTLMDFTEYGGGGVGSTPPPAGSPSSVDLHQYPDVDQNRRVCRELAVVEETTALKNLVTCSQQPRSSVVFVSKTNRVKITFSPRNIDEDQPPYFVLKYDVYGCVYPSVLPSMTHLVHDVFDDVSFIRVQCNQSDDFWTLRCDPRNGTWKGQLGNCTIVPSPEIPTFDRFSYGMSLLLILVVAVSICFIFLASGLLCLYRSKRLRRQQLRQQTKLGIVGSMSSYSSSCRSLDPSSKSSTVPSRSHASITTGGGGRAIYCPLDPKCTTLLHPIDDPPPPTAATLFHSLQQEPLCRRTMPVVSTPVVRRAVTAQQLMLLPPPHPPCTCAVRAARSLMSCSAAGQAATRPSGVGGLPPPPPRTLLMDDDLAPGPVTFTTFKPASPENEYGRPKPRLTRLVPCQHNVEPSCCAGSPQGARWAPTATMTATVKERRPDICCQEPTVVEESATV